MRNKGRRGLSVLIAFLVLAGIAGVRGANEPQNDFRFSILGDRTGDADAQIYERVWQEMGQFSPDFVINVGDSIQGGNDATAEAEWRALHSVWDKYKRPQYFTAGNHDIWSPASRKILIKRGTPIGKARGDQASAVYCTSTQVSRHDSA